MNDRAGCNDCAAEVGEVTPPRLVEVGADAGGSASDGILSGETGGTSKPGDGAGPRRTAAG